MVVSEVLQATMLMSSLLLLGAPLLRKLGNYVVSKVGAVRW
jgi:Na+(H+)/acetate symporter ActP